MCEFLFFALYSLLLLSFFLYLKMVLYARDCSYICTYMYVCVHFAFSLTQSRVVGQNPGERNFHIFYQLLGGATADVLRKLEQLLL